MANSKTCGICLELILNNNFEKLDFDKKRNLKFLVNLDITVAEEVIICSKCANICREVYDFKNACLKNNDTLKTFIRFNADCKSILEDVIIKKNENEVNCEEEKVCQFCLNYFEATSLIVINMEKNAFIKGMLEKCLPELDMNTVHNPYICLICMDLLKKCFNFISKCEASELIRDLKKAPGDFIDPEAVITKIEIVDNCLDYSCVKVEEDIEETIETKRQIKTEYEDLDMDEDCKGLLNEGQEESGNHLKETDDETTPTDYVEDKKYVCTVCSYQAKYRSTLKNHYAVHQAPPETVGFKCDKCPYVTKWKSSLTKHYLLHKNPSEITMFKCEKCPFETKRKDHLTHHLVIHRDPSEITIYKCIECTYETRYRQNFQNHKKTHLKARERQNLSGNHLKETDDVGFKCEKCPFETKEKDHLTTHLLMHRKPTKKITIYTCAECAFETRYKGSFQNHRNTHLKARESQKLSDNHLKETDDDTTPTDNVEDRKYACTLCPYRAKFKATLKNHILVHRALTEIVGFKCDKCPYVTKWKPSLTKHYLVHKNPSEITMFKCENCPFETKHKNHLRIHVLKHRNPSEITVYTCAECTYETRYEPYFRRHKKTHLWARERQNLRSLMCSARHKKEPKEHNIIHKDLKEIEHFKCNECSYVTNEKTSLRKHQAVHIDISKRHRYSCTECIYETLTKSNLTRHRKNIHGPGKKHEKTYICYECSHETTNRQNFVYHLGIHRQGKIPNKKRRPLSGTDKLYKCNECDYETKYRRSFGLHLMTHKDSSETTMHK